MIDDDETPKAPSVGSVIMVLAAGVGLGVNWWTGSGIAGWLAFFVAGGLFTAFVMYGFDIND